jgi:hypothetical protein
MIFLQQADCLHKAAHLTIQVVIVLRADDAALAPLVKHRQSVGPIQNLNYKENNHV